MVVNKPCCPSNKAECLGLSKISATAEQRAQGGTVVAGQIIWKPKGGLAIPTVGSTNGNVSY